MPAHVSHSDPPLASARACRKGGGARAAGAPRREGGSVFARKELLGHGRLEMAGGYVTLAQTDVEAQDRQFSPVERLGKRKWHRQEGRPGAERVRRACRTQDTAHLVPNDSLRVPLSPSPFARERSAVSELSPESREQAYLSLVLDAIRVCADYRPRFGQGRAGGFTLQEFKRLYGADPFYSWFGLDSPLMYAAHRAAGGMTSVYRQIGIGCQWLFNRILQDELGLTAAQANWAYTVPTSDGRGRTLTLDGRIPLAAIADPAKRLRVEQWLSSAADLLQLPATTATALEGAVSEVRQGYKSKDSKRQNADVANASNAYAYLPVVVLLSTQIDSDVADRYARARWLVLLGTTGGDALHSTYHFVQSVVGYDLAAFFQRHTDELKTTVEAVLASLLSENDNP